MISVYFFRSKSEALSAALFLRSFINGRSLPVVLVPYMSLKHLVRFYYHSLAHNMARNSNLQTPQMGGMEDFLGSAHNLFQSTYRFERCTLSLCNAQQMFKILNTSLNSSLFSRRFCLRLRIPLHVHTNIAACAYEFNVHNTSPIK